MRRLKFLLRPGWLILAVIVAGFAYLCFSVLAPWQLGKNTSTSERNQLISDSVSADPVPVESILPASGPLATHDEWRQVRATGTYLPDKDVLIRLRTIEDSPAFEVITPLQLSDGRVVLVNRGYVRPVEGGRPPQFAAAPTGEVTIAARPRLSEGTIPGKDPIRENGYSQVYFINPAQIGTAAGVTPVDLYLQLAGDQPGSLGTIPLPQLDAGPYLSYGLQWLAFGIMAPLGLAYFVRAELRERRRDRADTEATPPVAAEPTATEPVATTKAEAEAEDDIVLPRRGLRRSAPEPTTLTATEAKLADRYGKRR
ncbi:SURF1 family protein [Rhodococcus spelaei]|uniref:SURF1-like protein n=1 Tax=Rhodococcus spelaei TaxID=2546320 RepID=A0A541BML1_9NOCA|nr:SURF1 family protein [Rhodococcus spelaei]TQF73514.1 SURF1 family protein [Rhodococcus spelaei]